MSESERSFSAVSYAVQTDVGMRRSNNQDSATTVLAESPTGFQRKGHLFVVADGMGAHAAGELASQMAVQRISQHYFRDQSDVPVMALQTAIVEANREIYLKGQNNPEFHNMGTTASVLTLLPTGAIVGHVGDSRVYRWRKNLFEQLTFDHSLVWEMEANGTVQPNSELSRAIPKNVITRSLGPNAEVMVDTEGPWPALRGDRYLLCSDGLTGQVTDPEIGAIVGAMPADRAAQVLIDLANLRGGPDNITVIIVHVEADFNQNNLPVATRRKIRNPPPVLWVIVAVSLLMAFPLGINDRLVGMLAALAVAIACTIYMGWYCWFCPQASSTNRAHAGLASGRGPYRQYQAKPTNDLVQQLANTVQKLRDAVAEQGWKIDWSAIDQLQADSQSAQNKKQLSEALRLQAEAVMMTMQQLRAQRAQSTESIDL